MIAGLLDELTDSLANIVEFGVYTGFRRENILDLQIQDIVFHDLHPTAEVRHIVKGGKYRTDSLGIQAVRIIRRAVENRTEGFVFISSRTGTRYKAIHKSFDSAVSKLDLRIASGQKLCFHDTRRLCATWLLQYGRSLDEVREILGHSDRATTDKYAKLVVSGDAFNVLPDIRKK